MRAAEAVLAVIGALTVTGFTGGVAWILLRKTVWAGPR